MDRPTVSPQQKRALAIATVIALVFGAYFLRQFFSLVVVAAVLAYLFTPLYNRLNRRLKPSTAAMLTLFATIAVVVIPLLFVGFFATGQLRHLIKVVSDQTSSLDVRNITDQTVTTINNTLARLPFGSYEVSQESILTGLKNVVNNFGSVALDYLTGFVGSLFGLISTSIIYIFVFLSFIRKGPYLVKMFRDLNPLGEDIADMYTARAGAMVKGTVKGQFVIAVVQGFIGALTIAIAGLPGAFFVLFLILSALSIIPLGGGILAIPIGIAMALFGNVLGGVIVVAGHLLLTTNVDNILRPKLVPEEAKLDAALMLLAVFAGLRMFGFLGIVIGPTIMVLIVTTIKTYLVVYRNYKPDQPSPKKQSLFYKLSHHTESKAKGSAR